MVDIFKREICNYCKNEQQDKNEYCNCEIIEIEKDGLKVLKCIEYQKDSSKIISTTPPLPVTAKKDYINYHET